MPECIWAVLIRCVKQVGHRGGSRPGHSGHVTRSYFFIHKKISGHAGPTYKCGIKLNDQLIMIKLSSPLNLVKVAKYNEMKKYHVRQISSNFLGCISIIQKIRFCPYYSPCGHGVQYILCLFKLYYRQLKCIISF